VDPRPKVGCHAAQERGVEALLELAKDSAAVRRTIVNHHKVQSHLSSMFEPLRKHTTRSDFHTPPSDSTSTRAGLWRHDLGGAPGTENHAQAFQHRPVFHVLELEAAMLPRPVARLGYPLSEFALGEPAAGADEGHALFSIEPPAAWQQAGALPGCLVTRARDQHEVQEPLHDGWATAGLACEPEEEDLLDAQLPGQPRQDRSRRNKRQDDAEEPPQAGDTALIVKGIRSTCQRRDVYAMLEASGLAGTFDLLYVPKDFASHRNRGYFHINFKQTASAEELLRLVNGWPSSWAMNQAIGRLNSRLVACRARYQGLRSFVMDIVSGRKLRAQNEDYRPWIYLSDPSGRHLTTEMAKQLLSTELPGYGGAQFSPSDVSVQ